MKRRKGINNKKNDITDACRDLIVRAYGEYRTQTLEGRAEDGSAIAVESKLFDGEDFGFRRVTVYTPERDEDGNVVRDRKGRPVRKTERNGKREVTVSDTEDIPLKEDVSEYMAREVEPYNPGAFVDPKKTVVGYTIPFTRAFYKYRELEPADRIAERILGHERALEESLRKLFGEVR
jgi:type I restriction enzyme M protein